MTHRWQFTGDDQTCIDCGVDMNIYLFTNRDCILKLEEDDNGKLDFSDVDWEKLSRELEAQMEKYERSKCECGAIRAKTTHAYWCPIYDRA